MADGYGNYPPATEVAAISGDGGDTRVVEDCSNKAFAAAILDGAAEGRVETVVARNHDALEAGTPQPLVDKELFNDLTNGVVVIAAFILCRLAKLHNNVQPGAGACHARPDTPRGANFLQHDSVGREGKRGTCPRPGKAYPAFEAQLG